MESYVNWVHKAQFASDPNNIDVRGEPKFFLGNGGAYGNVYNQVCMACVHTRRATTPLLTPPFSHLCRAG